VFEAESVMDTVPAAGSIAKTTMIELPAVTLAVVVIWSEVLADELLAVPTLVGVPMAACAYLGGTANTPASPARSPAMRVQVATGGTGSLPVA
jgi:hypothetical protein